MVYIDDQVDNKRIHNANIIQIKHLLGVLCLSYVPIRYIYSFVVQLLVF